MFWFNILSCLIICYFKHVFHIKSFQLYGYFLRNWVHILGWFWYMHKDLPMCLLCKSIFVACMQEVHKFAIDYICLHCLFVYLFHWRSCLCFVWQGHIILPVSKICIYMYYDTHTIYLFLCKILSYTEYLMLWIMLQTSLRNELTLILRLFCLLFLNVHLFFKICIFIYIQYA